MEFGLKLSTLGFEYKPRIKPFKWFGLAFRPCLQEFVVRLSEPTLRNVTGRKVKVEVKKLD